MGKLDVEFVQLPMAERHEGVVGLVADRVAVVKMVDELDVTSNDRVG